MSTGYAEQIVQAIANAIPMYPIGAREDVLKAVLPLFERLHEERETLIARLTDLHIAVAVIVSFGRDKLDAAFGSTHAGELVDSLNAAMRLLARLRESTAPTSPVVPLSEDSVRQTSEMLRRYVEERRFATQAECSCWLGTDSTCGSSVERENCAVHGTNGTNPTQPAPTSAQPKE